MGTSTDAAGEADDYFDKALDARHRAKDATGAERADLLAQATLDIGIATFFELRRANLDTEAHTRALTRHGGRLDEHYRALLGHADALTKQALAMDRHGSALEEFERSSRRMGG
ncbi:hypothetical protein GCM10022243_25720 [Saccharothrix violaceirubra]|uniref:Excreted virulence factor EspC (Type VII ESX diderm) n=1 Tax=Saccharothrix violaceirubra TaxID=413306 RepID=A0A7W7T3T8_9PSEU|nr:hypothetical protein [Saccharothrix violaceirubra]MBB4966059.1 hypothetical protein [Saccharothrix violaceirubra]